MSIIGNKELIAVNQDPLGYQARRIWSDKIGAGDRLIATKCSSGVSGAYEDKVEDQIWELQTDGHIKSVTSGLCLHELTPRSEDEAKAFNNTSLIGEGGPLDLNFGLFGVTTSDCADATVWLVDQDVGGSIVSQSSGRCLEVSKLEFLPLFQGKRIQTGICRVCNYSVYTF